MREFIKVGQWVTIDGRPSKVLEVNDNTLSWRWLDTPGGEGRKVQITSSKDLGVHAQLQISQRETKYEIVSQEGGIIESCASWEDLRSRLDPRDWTDWAVCVDALRNLMNVGHLLQGDRDKMIFDLGKWILGVGWSEAKLQGMMEAAMGWSKWAKVW